MRPQVLKDFIKRNEHLFWYTPTQDKLKISDELLLENVLNYGTLETVKELFELMGVKKAKTVFENMKERKEKNIYPELHHFFSEYFKRIA